MGFGKLCVLGVLLALVLAVDGSAPLPARPPRAPGGFIVNESSITSTSTSSITSTSTASTSTSVSGSPKSSATTEPPSFVSVGIRSGCARERAATATTLRNKGVSGTSAASRLRGGSTWIPQPPVILSRADLEHAQAKTISSTDPISLHRPTESSSCNNKGGGGGAPNQFTVSKQRVMEDESVEPIAFEDEEDGAGGGSGGFGVGAAGGGGGGGRVGAPSFPRALKKFAWVP